MTLVLKGLTVVQEPQLQVQAETSSHRSSQVLDGSPNNSDLEQSSRHCRGGRLPRHFQEPAVCAPILILGHTGVMSSALCRDSTRTRTSQAHRRQPRLGRPRLPQTRMLQLVQQAVNVELIISNGQCHQHSGERSSKQ